MRLTLYTDYALRVMIYLGASDDRLSSIGEIAQAYRISQSHLMKIVPDLGAAGYIETIRGRNGGIRLGKPADAINLGQLVRHTEGSFLLADCPNCLIAPACGLTGVFAEAVRAFLAVLDKYSVADLLAQRSALRQLLAVPAGEVGLAHTDMTTPER